jgi:serine/threonine protein kinase
VQRSQGAGHNSPVGERIGPYRLIQPLGEGGMGVVHLALDPTGRAVAIKVLREHIAHDREARTRLRREVETLALVQDPRVAAVLDADTEGPRPYIVTRYIPGPALDQVVSESGPLQGEDLLRLGRGLWGALKAIHGAGVIHRDLKPANVVLLDGDPVVIDFGIAHVADDIRLTMTGLVMGTPGYLSPEVVQGAPVTEATDWWGWAATLAFAASGAPPFGRGPMDVVLDRVRRGQADLSGVDQRLMPLLQAALSPIPAERPHADEVLQALDWRAADVPATLAIPLAGASPTREWAGSFTTGPSPTGPSPAGSSPTGPPPALTSTASPPGPPGAPQDQGHEGRSGEQSAPADDSYQEPGGEGGQRGTSRPDPRTGQRSRVTMMLALAVGVLGVATIWPMVAICLVALWSFCARFADRSITSWVVRRHLRGRRRSDVPVAIVASPWHAVVAALVTAVTLLIPAAVAVGATYSVAFASAALAGGDPEPNRPVPLVVGGILGLFMCWLGPGGSSLSRGSRTLLRSGVPGKGAADLVGVVDFLVATFFLIGIGLGVWAWVSGGQPDWWPLSADLFPALARYL